VWTCVICSSVYGGPEVDHGHGKGTVRKGGREGGREGQNPQSDKIVQ